MIEVIGTDEFTSWYGALPDEQAEAVTRAVSILESMGSSLGDPHAKRIPASFQSCELCELTPQGTALRVLYKLEDGGKKALLLYGHDLEREARVAEPAPPLPAMERAHLMIATKIYHAHRTGRAGGV